MPSAPETALPAGLRYQPLSLHYGRRFGCKVYKVGVSTATTCPNREGLKGMRTCIFCDEWGSAAYPEQRGEDLAAQIRANGARIRQRYGAHKLLVYFQAYTNTFERLSRLEALFQEALAQPDVVGLVIGTRPDCLSRGLLKRLDALARATYVSVELGVQTLDDGQLAWLERGHDRACSLAALRALAEHPAIESCAHLMFGQPGETDRQLRETAAVLGTLGVTGVKLHNLHVLRGTPLAAAYRTGRFEPVTLAEYARKVALFLEHLPPCVVVHRLSAVASRWEEALAPAWVREKLRPAQAIQDHMARVDTWQGKAWRAGAGSAGSLSGEPRSVLLAGQAPSASPTPAAHAVAG